MALFNYSFAIPTRIKFGQGVISKAGDEARALGARKVMLVADRGVIKSGLTKPIEEALSRSGLPFVVFDYIEPCPRDVDCHAGYETAKRQSVDLLIAVGGGSSMDTAKAIGTLLTHGGNIKDWCGFQLLEREITPVIAVPTTAGTGSEVTPFAVITDTMQHRKLSISDPRVTAKVALVDPSTLLKLPSGVMASTGIAALTHVLEAYTCPSSNPHTDAYALYAIELIHKNLRKAVSDPDIDACTGMMLGSNLAGIAFGHANATLLPAVTELNISVNIAKYAKIAKALGIPVWNMSDEEAAYKGMEAVEQLCADVGCGHP